VIVTGSVPVVAGAWNYCELKFMVGASGTCETHLNGGADIPVSIGNFGTTAVDNVALMGYSPTAGPVSGPTMRFDDVYVCSLIGSMNNNYLGDVHVETIFPNADGAHNDWIPNSGVNHFDRVSEVSPDSDTTYVSSQTVGATDTYDYPSLITSAGGIFAVQTNLWAIKTDAASRLVAPVVRRGTSDSVGAPAPLATSYTDLTQIWEQDPNAGPGPWNIPNFNASQFGIQVTS